MATIYDVAEAAGVSPKTAARILGGDYGGRPANRARVQEAALRVGYVRNQQAANLRSGRSRLIGVIVPDLQNPHYPAFYQHVHDIAVAHGYHLLLSSTSGRAEEQKHALRLFELNRVDAIILNAAEGESDRECDDILARLTGAGTVAVVAGRPARGLAVDVIRIDNRAATARAVAHLHDAGHRRIGFVGGPRATLAGAERLAGYRDGCKTRGLPVDERDIGESPFTIAGGTAQTAALLARPDRPTALLAANDLLAIGAMRAAQDAGLRVPRDLAVIGFGDNPLATLVSPRLTTLRIPVEQIAIDCVNSILERLDPHAPRRAPRNRDYRAELIVRESA